MGESGMFGNYTRTLDDKKRVMLPAKLRDKVGSHFYISLGPDGVFEIRDSSSFEVWKSKLLNANTLNKNARSFARILLGNTIEVDLDKQGRLKFPEELSVQLGVTKEITFVGVGNKVEIWPAEKFKIFQNSFSETDSLDSLAEKLLKDGVEL